ncbi:MAG: spermidine/putrescine ABC transporter permease PotB [Desulfovibrionaceae bacterium]
MPERNLFRRVSIHGTGLWLTLFVVAPFTLMAVVSLLTRGQTDFVRPALSLDGYRAILSPVFLTVFWNSAYIAGGATLFCLAVGYPFAYILGRMRSRWKNLLLLLVIIPFWTNSLIRTYALVFMIKSNGLINTVLLALGLIDAPLTIYYTETAVFIGLTYTLLPFMILPLYASIEKLDPHLLEAARDLGAGTRQTFWRVVLPLTMPGVVTGSMLVFLTALGMFYIPDILGGAKTMLLGNYIKNQFLMARDWPTGAAAGVVLTVLMTALLLLYYRSYHSVRRGQEDDA